MGVERSILVAYGRQYCVWDVVIDVSDECLLCLLQAWDYIMAFWLEAIRSEIPHDERQELKVLLW